MYIFSAAESERDRDRYTPFTRYNRLSNRTTVLNEQPLFVQPVVNPFDNRLYTVSQKRVPL